MDRFLHRFRGSRPVLVALGLLLGFPCAARDTVLRVGVPHAYEQQVLQRAGDNERCTEQASACVRYRYALGSDYQVLEWLQNGKVDGAVVSSMALELLRRTIGERFEQEFVVDDKLPHGGLGLRHHHTALRAERDGIALPAPEAELDRLFRDLQAGSERGDGVVVLASHLSSGVPELFARIQAWSKATEKGATGGGRAADMLMNRLLPRLRFAADDRVDAPLRIIVAEEEGGADADWFVVRRPALPPAARPEKDRMPALRVERAFLDYLRHAREAAGDTELGRFAAGNYVSESVGWRNRFRFAFTLDELRSILRSHAARDPADDDGIALVLTGGGVKAAYQTKLIDHLYGNGYLRNRFAPGEADPASLPVKYVVGTSGGALLGMFVASLDDARPRPPLDLSGKLWYRTRNGTPTRLLDSRDVFPAVDLMRWLSLLWCLVAFTVVCAATSLYLHAIHGKPTTDRCDGAGRFWRTSFWWLILLAGTPWLLVYINGEHGAEHIPAIQGLFYFIFVLIAIYSDNRLVVTRVPRAGKSAWPPVALAAAGAALVIGALLNRDNPTIIERLDFSITLPALIACFGMLMVVLGWHGWLVRCAPRLEPIASDIWPGLGLLAGVCVLSYLPLIVAAQFGVGSLFELAPEFWVVLGAMALIVSIALACLAYRARMPRLRRSFDFLLASHPARCADASHWISTARYSRIVLAFLVGWGWWNLIVAPGLYGNQNALGYFRAAAHNVFGDKAFEACGPDEPQVTFHALYAVPVTALLKGIERYVMFQPAQAHDPGTDAGPLGGYRSWLSIANDPRWITIDDAQDRCKPLMKVAFASGSPFPVFPAHSIELPTGKELMVDGGYAHNVPVEAGKRLGARRVLVISSSPREPPVTQTAAESRSQVVGKLTWMLRWIIPYLYERSQVEDALSAEDLVVALIAPSAKPEGWPLLTDFHPRVIERMFDESTKDQARRIGSIENWGRPAFTYRSANTGSARTSY